MQYNPPDATFHIDILTRLGDAYSFADLKVERIALDALTVSVVTPQTLYEMKRDTIRLKDKVQALRRQRVIGEHVATAEEDELVQSHPVERLELACGIGAASVGAEKVIELPFL